MNPKLKRPLFKLINQKTKSVDIYHHGGSMWLIFTDEKKWVIELTKDGTLWYNHYFFQDCFKYLSLDVVENQHYITEWVEDIIQNGVINTTEFRLLIYTPVEDAIKNGVRDTSSYRNRSPQRVEDTIQYGVRDTFDVQVPLGVQVENIIQNGMKETIPSGYLGSIEMKGKIVHQFESPKQNNEVEDTIQNGVKHTAVIRGAQTPNVEDTIKNGVRYTDHRRMQSNSIIEDTIQNGVKETKKIEHNRTTYHGYFNQERGSHTPLDTVQDVLKNGIKHTQPHVLEILNPIGFEPTLKENKRMNEVNNVLDKGIKKTKAMDEWVNTENILDNVINNGVKELQPLPAQDGNRDWGLYYQRKGVPTKPHTKYVDEVITEGIKETWGYENQPQMRVNEVIKQGTKENPSL